MAGRRPQRPGAVDSLSISVGTDPASAFQQVEQAVQKLQVDVRRAASVTPSTTIGVMNVMDFGVTGDGVADDTAVIQDAIDASQGRTLYFPKGTYKVTKTLVISTSSHHWVGDYANRAHEGGTQFVFYGTGPCVQVGVNNGHPFTASDYDGPQDQMFENLWFSHGAPDTALVGANSGATPRYKAGAYGIWDWRGGGIIMRSVGLEMFEANFVGINSDFSSLNYIVSLYSPYGLYIGPLSDQVVIRDLNSFFCDRAITVDGSHHTRIVDCSMQFCGTNVTSTVEIRKGSSGTCLEHSWFERSGAGYQGTDAQSFVSIGEVDGCGPTGTIVSAGGTPNTASVHAATIRDCHFYNVGVGLPSHTKYLASVGFARQLLIDHPAEYVSSALNNFDNFVCVQAASAPPATETQVEIRGVDSHFPPSQLFSNLGGGAPVFASWTTGSARTVIHSSLGSNFDGALDLSTTISLSNEIIVALASSQNDYNPTGLSTASMLIIQASAPITITGFAGGSAGRLLMVWNGAASNITFTDGDVLSVAANRIFTRSRINQVMTTGTGCLFYYSPTFSRWIAMADTL